MKYTLSDKGILIIENGTKNIPTLAFYNNSRIKIVIIPKSVHKIGKKAFYLCSNIEKVVIPPHGLRYIEDRAFGFCLKMEQ